jgi:hypothetical protein
LVSAVLTQSRDSFTAASGSPSGVSGLLVIKGLILGAGGDSVEP